MPELVLLTRAGCHLCEEAKEQLEGLRREIPFTLRVVDVDTDPALQAQYMNDVPVLLLDGRKIAKHRLDLARLRRPLVRAAASER
jgi:glutaredoxin